MNGESPDIKQTMLQRLKGLFPELFAENQLDWEKLKAAFGEDINFVNERYVLNWAGKADAFRVLQQPTTATLKPIPEESVNFDTTENLFIEGENLEVLKVLQKAYYSKVKCIIIDPPYNTGSDSFIYPDRFSEKKEDYLKRIGDKDEEGYLLKEGMFRKNSKDSGHFHSNWLSMMYPRLFLAKNLLRDDGVIFVHIDDNEVHNLRMVMNEIFGEENFVASIIWQKKQSPQNDATYFSDMHDYILVYAKRAMQNKSDTEGWQRGLFVRNEEQIGRYSNPDNDQRGNWASVDCTSNKSAEQRPNLYYLVINPNNKKEVWPPKQRVWRFEKRKFDQLILENRIWWGENGENFPRLKRFLSEVQGGVVPSTWWTREFAGDNQSSRREIRALFNEGNVDFDTPKPTRLLKRILETANHDESGEIILDFFAGSGTTAQAVLELNKEDGGNRKFILVQMPEPCDENSETYKAGYKTIADIGKERIRRVIKNLTPHSPLLKERGLGERREGSYAENLFKGASPTLFENANQLRKNKTNAEEALWQAIRNKEIENCKFRRQHPIGQFIADFYCHEKKLVIEIDGGYHNEAEQKAYDEARTHVINEFGVRVIRFTNEEILNSLPRVLKQISETLDSPSPSGEGRGEVGFKVFKLSPSNFKIWRGAEIDSEEKLTEQLNAFTNPIKPNTEKQNMLYELMLKAGYELTSPLSPLSSMRGDVGEAYSINNNELIIALDTMNEKLIEQIIATKPQKVITLDSLFTGNDQLKTNTVLQMRDAGVDFKTV